MTLEHFGNVMPIHCGVLSLIGWHLSRGESHLIVDDAARIAEMRRGHDELVAITGLDFGFNLGEWRSFLLEFSAEYKHPYAFAVVDQAVQDAIMDPTFIRLAKRCEPSSRSTGDD